MIGSYLVRVILLSYSSAARLLPPEWGNGVNAQFFGWERCAEDYLLVWLRVGESGSLW